MSEFPNYTVIVSDRAKRMLETHQIQDDTVYVDYILDCRKDYSWLIH